MENSTQTRIKKVDITSLSSHSLKEHVISMLELSTRCRAILECVNDETGEYRIVLEGIIENEEK